MDSDTNNTTLQNDHLQQTSLHDIHVALGARMMPFGGFDMPVQYSGIIDEHMAVRNAAGLFDVSHMGEFLVEGPGAFDTVQHLVTNDASKLYDGRAMYTAMCTESGGIVDDLLVYRKNDSAFMLVVNASNIEKDWAWVNKHLQPDTKLTNISSDTALIAIQGPAAFEIVQSVTRVDISDLKFYHFLMPEAGAFLGLNHVILSHTGYTGEKGLEIYTNAADAPVVWNRLMQAGQEHGLKPIGLGARDTLRLESGFCLYGNDITEETSPFEAGLGWITKLNKDDFVGKSALERIKAGTPDRKLVGFVMSERGIPRHENVIVDYSTGTEIGIVTSGTQSPVLGKGIGMGYVPNDPQYTSPGSVIAISSRGKAREAVITKPPFHKS